MAEEKTIDSSVMVLPFSGLSPFPIIMRVSRSLSSGLIPLIRTEILLSGETVIRS